MVARAPLIDTVVEEDSALRQPLALDPDRLPLFDRYTRLGARQRRSGYRCQVGYALPKLGFLLGPANLPIAELYAQEAHHQACDQGHGMQALQQAHVAALRAAAPASGL